MQEKTPVQLVVEYLLDNASTFLVELGKFHPFGAALDTAHTLHNIDVEEAPIQTTIEQLESRISDKIKENTFVLGGICILVRIQDAAGSLDALELRLQQTGGKWGRMFCAYKVNGEKMQIGEFVRTIEEVQAL